jgi:hypothetical protein
MLLAGLGVSLLTTANAADMVVIINPSATAPSKDEISNVYLGKSLTFTPVDLPESSPDYAEFYHKLTGRDASQIKALRMRLVFTGQGQQPKSLADATAVKKAVTSNPKTIGYIEKSEVDSSVKVALPLG